MPPLLSEFPRAIQVQLVGVVPFLFGMVCGFFAGISEPTYLVLVLLAIVGGFLAGFEHPSASSGAGRGVIAGALFGAGIVIAHSAADTEALVELPSPLVLLIVGTAIAGALLAAGGAKLRQRSERASA